MSQVRHHMLDDHKFWSRNLLPYSYFLQRDGRLDNLHVKYLNTTSQSKIDAVLTTYMLSTLPTNFRYS